jgi:hypothetical protein
MVPGIWLFVTTYTQNAIYPSVAAAALNATEIRRLSDVVVTLGQNVSGSTAADVASRSDRGQLNERVHALEAEASKGSADLRATSAETKVSLAEIETQFHAASDIGNLRSIWQNRINSLLWEKVHPGEHYPAEAFFPTSVFKP